MARKKQSELRVVGEVRMVSLDVVKPNTWNPNHMTAFQKESLQSGLRADGWLTSQSLLIWGTDEKGEEHNVIIDGEHRWTAAKSIGFTEGPMVFLQGLSLAQAKALTIKMNSKRGEFDEDGLADLVLSLSQELNVPDLGMDLGIAPNLLMEMLSVEPVVSQTEVEPDKQPAPSLGTMPSGKTEHVKMVQLFFTSEDHQRFMHLVEAFSKTYGTSNVTETVFAVLKNAAS